jgi:hypothetical protein
MVGEFGSNNVFAFSELDWATGRTDAKQYCMEISGLSSSNRQEPNWKKRG